MEVSQPRQIPAGNYFPCIATQGNPQPSARTNPSNAHNQNKKMNNSIRKKKMGLVEASFKVANQAKSSLV